MRITEIDLDIGRQRESLVASHFLAPVPGQRFVEFLWQFASVFDQGVGHGSGIFSRELDQHQVARLTFDECRNLTILAAAQQITFPMPRYMPSNGLLCESSGFSCTRLIGSRSQIDFFLFIYSIFNLHVSQVI